jgi:hypothetical protein
MTNTLVINFGDNLKNDTSAKFWVFFTSLPNPINNFGHTNAILVKDNTSADMTGLVAGASSISYTFDYTNNSQGGRTPNTPVAITVVGLGLETSQYIKATTTITNYPFNSVSLVSLLERNYLNN